MKLPLMGLSEDAFEKALHAAWRSTFVDVSVHVVRLAHQRMPARIRASILTPRVPIKHPQLGKYVERIA